MSVRRSVGKGTSLSVASVTIGGVFLISLYLSSVAGYVWQLRFRSQALAFDVFGHAVMGGGVGALFLSVFFAAARYELISQMPAFAITAVVCAVAATVAIRREAPLLAYVGFVGGYLAPRILGENVDALEGLFLALCTHRANGEPAWSITHRAGTDLMLEIDTAPNCEPLTDTACVSMQSSFTRHITT